MVGETQGCLYWRICSIQILGHDKTHVIIKLTLLTVYVDGCEACYTALEAGRQAMDNVNSSKLEDPVHRNSCLSRWPFIQSTSKVPSNTQDLSRLLKSLQPLLQDTIQKKRTTSFWESCYTVSGPLTWKDFHLLAGRGIKLLILISVLVVK